MNTTVSDLYRYPVKSMGGHALTETRVEANGFPGDRCWTLIDEQRGGIKGGKRFPAIMGMNAQLTEEPGEGHPSPPVTITLPDGTCFNSTDAEANRILSTAVGSPVSIWPLVPADQLDHYRREPPDPGTDMEASLREVFARTPDEPLPDLSAFPPDLMAYESPPGTYFDAFPLLIMSTASLRAMSTAHPESNFDVRRFRPNIVVEIEDDGAPSSATSFPEEAWAGRTGTFGTTVLKFEMACPRCVMTTHGFDSLPKDPKIMRGLVQSNQGNLGLYASVVEPGIIRVGDRLELD